MVLFVSIDSTFPSLAGRWETALFSSAVSLSLRISAWCQIRLFSDSGYEIIKNQCNGHFSPSRHSGSAPCLLGRHTLLVYLSGLATRLWIWSYRRFLRYGDPGLAVAAFQFSL